MSQVRIILILIACCTAISSAQNSAAPSSEAPPSQAQPPRPQTVVVPNDVMLGRVEHKTMPVYPEEAMKKGIQGDVIFKIEVDETGKITSSALVTGDPLLVAASKDALRTFRFHPYLLDGTPVKVKSRLGFHFAADKTADGVSGRVECIASIPD
jgi:TonB family protein